jgi:long-chain acyl-CoA synthetase
MTPLERLRQRADKHAQNLAFVSGEDRWTYGRLAAEAARLARGLAALGIRAGDRVVLHLWNCPEMLVAYYACFELGAIAAPLRTAFKAAELARLMQRLQPSLYIGDAGLYHAIADAAFSYLPATRRFVVGANPADGLAKPWAALFAGAGDVSSTCDADAPAVLINTSGTTGEPKFVVHSHRSLAAVAAASGVLGIDQRQIVPVFLPLAHGSGLFISICSLEAGAPFILLERFDADGVLDAIARHHATLFFGMPAMCAALVERQRERPREVRSLRLCLTGGDVCPLLLQEQFEAAFGVPLSNVWGATEVVGMLTYGLVPGAVCRVVPGAQFRLVDEDGRAVERGDAGELLLRGPSVTPGYWIAPGVVETALRDGWFHTGDVMRQDETGDLRFVARKQDLIIRGGTNISPMEVENALTMAHPAIREAAVVGVPDPLLGERVVSFIRLTGRVRGDIRKDVLAAVARQLADYKVPERLEIVDSIPRNALGKIDRSRLAALVVGAA